MSTIDKGVSTAICSSVIPCSIRWVTISFHVASIQSFLLPKQFFLPSLTDINRVHYRLFILDFFQPFLGSLFWHLKHTLNNFNRRNKTECFSFTIEREHSVSVLKNTVIKVDTYIFF